MAIIVTAIVLVAAFVLIRIWTGAMNYHVVEQSSLATVEHRQFYLPKMGAIVVSVVVAGGLFILSLKFGKNTSLQSFLGTSAMWRTVVVFVAIAALGFFDSFRWRGAKDRYKYFYAFVLATLVTWIIIAFKRAFFEAGVASDPFLMALGMTCIVVGWRFLFGPWSASVKATVLGTFLFWVSYAILRYESREEVLATSIAAGIAVIPVVVWCFLFLRYHRERLSIVLLAFFAGMLSTVPILFYSELTKHGVELNFFYFKLIPLSFSSTSGDFVKQSVFQQTTGLTSTVLTTLVTYLLVGIIEEGSKYWVLRKSGHLFFHSIDDALQLAIIVALGFAFAENLANPNYFIGFVQDYLLKPPAPQWGSLIGGVVGRAVLTNMVHILSTGITGYFLGVALFASPLLKEQFQRGRWHGVTLAIHRMLSVRADDVYGRAHLAFGLVVAMVVHGCFDFVVSLPEVIPGNPDTVGALLNLSSGSFLRSIPTALIPSLLYIVGGFWLLAYLFRRTEDMKEFGAIVEVKAVVTG